MATSSPQPAIIECQEQISSISATHRHRWIDLALVLAIAFASPLLGSIYDLFYPSAHNYSNARLIAGILQETLALALFICLFTRQGRRLKGLSLGFRWTDIPKAFALFVAASFAMWAFAHGARYLWFFVTLSSLPERGSSLMFSTTSIWLLLPFLILNPIFEETLVRGYLMTEIIELRGSVLAAILLSIAVQTSYHLYYGVFGALTVGTGLAVFALYYGKSRRLIPVILAHCLWDLTALLQLSHR